MRDMVTMSDLSLCSDWRGGRKWEAGRVGRHLGGKKGAGPQSIRGIVPMSDLACAAHQPVFRAVRNEGNKHDSY
jgi:hypothetical protein